MKVEGSGHKEEHLFVSRSLPCVVVHSPHAGQQETHLTGSLASV